MSKSQTSALIPKISESRAASNDVSSIPFTFGIYALAAGVSTLDLVNQLNARLAQLDAMLAQTYGDSGEEFRDCCGSVQGNYMWACSELVSECIELSKHLLSPSLGIKSRDVRLDFAGTPNFGVYALAPGVTVFALISQLGDRLAQLDAMLVQTYGEVGEVLRNGDGVIQGNYMWSCAELASECRELSELLKWPAMDGGSGAPVARAMVSPATQSENNTCASRKSDFTDRKSRAIR